MGPVARGYALLGELFLRGVTDTTREVWRVVDPAIAESDAETHTRVMLLELAPYESVYLEPEGLCGSDGGVRELRARAGAPDTKDPDHVGEELLLLATVPGELRHELLDRHLLRWLPAFAASVPPPFTAAAALALDLVRAEGVRATPWDLPPVDEPAGVGALARHLCIPARAGGWFTPGFLSGVGRRLELAVGIGTRAETMGTLLRSAAHFGVFPALVAELDAEMARWEGLHEGPWLRRVAETRALLARVGTEIASS